MQCGARVLQGTHSLAGAHRRSNCESSKQQQLMPRRTIDGQTRRVDSLKASEVDGMLEFVQGQTATSECAVVKAARGSRCCDELSDLCLGVRYGGFRSIPHFYSFFPLNSPNLCCTTCTYFSPFLTTGDGKFFHSTWISVHNTQTMRRNQRLFLCVTMPIGT